MAYVRAAHTHLSNEYYLQVWYNVVRTVNTASAAQSIITVQLRIYNNSTRTTGRYNNNGNVSGNVTVNGTAYSFSGAKYDFNTASTRPAGSSQTLYTSGEITINHNTSSGAGSFTIQGRLQDPVWWTNNYSPSSSAPITLTALNRTVPSVTTSSSSITATAITIKSDTTYSGAVSSVSFWDSKSNAWSSATSTTAKSNARSYTGLTPNTTYRFQSSYQSSVNSLWGYSGTASYTTSRAAPAKATATLGTITTSSMVVTASATQGSNSPVDSYRFAISGSWSNWQSGNSYTFTGLNSNTSYNVQVQSRSGAVEGPASDSYSFKTDTTNPSVSAFAVTGTAQTTLTVSTTASAQAGVKSYTYYRNGTQVASGASSTYTFTGLTSKTAYTLKVMITDNKNRTATKEVSGITKSTVVNGVTLNSTSKTQNSISVSTAVSSAQAGIKNYIYALDGITQSTSTSNTYTYSSLVAGRSYTLKVTVTDNEWNTATDDLVVTTKYATPTLTNPVISNITATGAKIRYTATSALTWGGYRYKIDSGTWNTFTGTPQEINLTTLTPNTTHVIAIEAWNTENTYSAALTTQVKTLEDQWVSLSKNGGVFAKVNLYIVTTAGVTKIEKSKSKVIK